MTDPGANRPPLDLPILDEVGFELRRIFQREEQAPALARHGMRPPWRRSSLRIAVAAVLVALITAAVALAAGRLFGSPVAPEERLAPTTGWGVPIPSSVRLFRISAADPAGGLPWGIRIMHTTRGLGCIQFGRLSGGQLWVIGQDGAFHNDGRLHELPTDILEPEGCTSLDAHERTFIAAGRVAAPASGYVPGCNGPEGSNGAWPAHLRPCPAPDERALFYGVLGPQAKSITYTRGGRTVSVPLVGPDGAYLIVMRAQPNADPNVGGPHSPNGSSILPQGGLQQPIRSIEYQDGYVCRIGASGNRDTRGRSCSPPGYVPVALNTSEAKVRAPVSVRLLLHQPQPSGPLRENQIQVSFTTRVGILKSGEYDDANLINPCTGGSAGVEPPNDITAGKRLTIRFGLRPTRAGARPCPGIYHGSVRLVAQPFYFDDEPPNTQTAPPGLTVGEFSIRVP